jgi:hypothetical protein
MVCVLILSLLNVCVLILSSYYHPVKLARIYERKWVDIIFSFFLTGKWKWHIENVKNGRYVDMNFTQDQKFLGIICLPFIYLALNVICHVLLWFQFLWNFLTWRILKKIYKLSELVLFLFQVKFLGRKSAKHLSYLNIQILYSMNIMSCFFYVKLNNNFIFISCEKNHNI